MVRLDLNWFRLPTALAQCVRGKRVLVTAAGKAGSVGQAFALAAGLNGAEAVGVHFFRSYADGLETVEMINRAGGNAFPVQADLTNVSDAWALRSYVIRRLGGLPPDLVICNSGLAETGYALGRAPEHSEGESAALRRARVRQAFVDNLTQSSAIIDTKVHGFLYLTHLWAGEAQHFERPVQLVYVSSRQAVDPGQGVPGLSLANFAVLGLPRILRKHLGNRGDLARAFSVMLPFVRTDTTEAMMGQPGSYERWQPRMLEPWEAAQALASLLCRKPTELDDKVYQLNVSDPEDDDEGPLRATWSQIKMTPHELTLPWSERAPLTIEPVPR